jgi:hypothetical protein
MIDGNNYITMVPTAGPALIISIELEGPVQTYLPAAMTDADKERLMEWLESDASLHALAWAAHLLRDGGSLVPEDITEELELEE